MAVKIRLQRFGRKRHPYYHIVAADSRSPRDGRYIERIGSYNPNTNPASIDLDFEKAVQWVMDGAEPTHTVRQILKYKGVLHKKHLLRGVQKGALTEEEAEKLHSEWIAQKSEKIQAKLDKLSAEENAKLKETLERESKIAEERAEAIRQKRAEQEGGEEEGEATEASAEAEENAEAPETENAEAPEEKAKEPTEEKAEESTEEKSEEATESSEPAEAATKEDDADSEEKKDA